MRILITSIFLMVSAQYGWAENSTAGWGVQVRADSFDGTQSAMAFLREEDDGIGSASMFLVCDDTGSTRAFWQERLMGFLPDEKTVDIRLDENQITLSFVPDDIPLVGRVLATPQGDQRLHVFLALSEGQIAYRSGDQQGTFQNIGFQFAQRSVSNLCPF